MSPDSTESIECSLAVRRDLLSSNHRLSRFDEAYESSLPELHALPKQKLEVVNVDIPQAVCFAFGAIKQLQPWRSRILGALTTFESDYLDNLERYTMALMSAQVRYKAAKTGPEDIGQLTESAKRVFRILSAEARTLAERELLPAKPLKRVCGRMSASKLSLRLNAMVHVLRTAWSKIEARTGLTLGELDAAEEQACALVYACAYKNKPVQELARIAEMRQRAFTLFITAYNEVRRALQYVCRDAREVQRVMPTMYPRKRKRKASKNMPAPATIGAAATEPTSVTVEATATTIVAA